MKIELKKISFSERMSEETNAFTADLYINGKKVGYCKNTGCGGCTDYYGDSKEANQVIREAEAYFLSLPKVKPNGYDFMLQPTLENAIDEQLELYLKAKADKKMQKLMEKAIIWGNPNGDGYTYMNYKQPLSNIPVFNLQKLVDNVKAKYIKGNVVILNTNLKELGINI